MKKSKTMIFIAFVLSVLMLITSCALPDKRAALESCTKPDDTTLELWILQDVGEQDWTGFTEIPGWFGAHEYYGKSYKPETDENGWLADPDECVKYLITAWPDYADGGRYVTRISITDKSVTFFGLTIDSSVDLFDEVLTKNGMKRVNGSDKRRETADYEWQNEYYSISLTKRYGKPVIIIEAPVKNRNGIMF